MRPADVNLSRIDGLSWSLWPSLLLSLVLIGAGCRTPRPPLSPINLAERSWELRQGQAVWCPGPGRPELAGDLLLALRSTGESFVQFTKTPFPLVTARRSTNQWHIDFSTGRSFSGRGRPPARFIWLHLPEALAGAPLPRGWTQEVVPERRWRLVNRTTGEILEGYLTP